MGAIKFPHASGNSMSIAAPATNPASDLELKLPATIGSAGQVLMNSSTPGTLEFGAAGGGKLVKIEYMSTTSGVTSTDTDAWSDTNLTDTITMAQATNKLLIHTNLHCALYNSTTYDYASQRMNNLATELIWTVGGVVTNVDADGSDASGAYGFRYNSADTTTKYNNIMGFFPRTYFIDPDTASEIEIKIRFKAGKDNMSVGVNQSCRSTMTIFEIEYDS
jgi:hypothetical protein